MLQQEHNLPPTETSSVPAIIEEVAVQRYSKT